MAISINCSTCGKHYQAADHMAGRRVRCKQCGTTFQLPAGAADDTLPFQRPDDIDVAPAAPPTQVEPMAPPSRAARDAAAVVARTTAAARPARAADDADDDEDAGIPNDADARAQPGDDVFDGAFQEFQAARGNTPFVFPGSQQLDQYLPTVLVVGLVAWLSYQVVGNRVDEPAWVGIVRLLVILMTYAGVMFPICLAGVRMAARKMNYELPSAAAWRAFATFLFPVTIGCVVWLSSGTATGFIFGIIMGLMVGLPIMWLLFRIRPEDAPVSLGYGAGAFGVSIIASVILLAVLNLILVGVMRGAKSQHSLARSPFGPGFSWDGPTIVAPPKWAKPKAAPAAPRGEPVDNTEGKAFADVPPGPDPESGSASSDPGAGNDSTVAPDAPVAPEGDATDQVVALPPPADVPAGVPDAPAQALGPVVGKVQQRLAAKVRQVVHPILPGSAVAVVKDGPRANEDHVELLDIPGWNALTDVVIARVAGMNNEYVVSSDGAHLAWISNWPVPSIQVHSFDKGKILRPFIKLDPAAQQPHIVGFSSKDQIILMSHDANNAISVDVWDVNKVKRLRRLKIENCQRWPGNYAFSRDGKLMACLVRDDKASGRLDVYDISTGTAAKLVRKIEVDELQWGPEVTPTGLAFSHEGDKIAALFENQGQGLFLCWGANNDIPLHQHIYPGGLVGAGVKPNSFRGERFGLVDEGRGWILYGASVFDSKSGKLLGDLGIEGVYAQRVTSPDTVLLMQNLGDAGSALLEVRLDLNRAREQVARQ